MDAQVTLGAARASHHRLSIVDMWKALRGRWTAANAHVQGRPSALDRARRSPDGTHGKEPSIHRIASPPSPDIQIALATTAVITLTRPKAHQ